MLMNCNIDNSNHVLNAKKVEKKKAVYWLPKHRISVNFPCHLSQCCRLILIVTKRETALLLKKVKRMLYLYLRLCFVTLRSYTL